jgi:hypothetical protein
LLASMSVQRSSFVADISKTWKHASVMHEGIQLTFRPTDLPPNLFLMVFQWRLELAELWWILPCWCSTLPRPLQPTIQLDWHVRFPLPNHQGSFSWLLCWFSIWSIPFEVSSLYWRSANYWHDFLRAWLYMGAHFTWLTTWASPLAPLGVLNHSIFVIHMLNPIVQTCDLNHFPLEVDPQKFNFRLLWADLRNIYLYIESVDVCVNGINFFSNGAICFKYPPAGPGINFIWSRQNLDLAIQSCFPTLIIHNVQGVGTLGHKAASQTHWEIW